LEEASLDLFRERQDKSEAPDSRNRRFNRGGVERWVFTRPGLFRRHPAAARGSARGLRTIAAFEATKGALVLAVGLGLLSFVHRYAQNVGEEIVRRFHLNLAHHS